jgi:hypothetical protein
VTAAVIAVALVVAWDLRTPSRTLGGTWLTPPGGATQSEPFTTIESTILLRAHVAPADQVDHVNFTANWGAGWQSVCRVYHHPTSSGITMGSCADASTDPSQGIYGTAWDLRRAGVPAGALIQISFDVYGARDEGAPENLAPNGIHWVKHVAAAPSGSTA